ncbi:B- and T-lymphocyte attenuator isoform X4 [Ornithorhynchus anatinus]|uniref:B- and T-lymphocyte attenuator isoform X4 n=1 Tax=Ornithorhynchus anatinus TaxID=9258 RepID=UPI0010A7C7D7|nr:B- and T-lymphocyte attenuator isoform X4 [Ornithorhynchus anatinus]
MPTRELLPHLLLLLLHILVALALVSSQSDPCSEEVRIKRDSNHTLWSGESFILKCPVIYCAVRPTVSWCVLYHSHCFRLQNMLQNTTEKNNTLELNLYFQPAWVNDTGLYICEANFSKKTIRSHQVTIIVKGAQINTTNPPSTLALQISLVPQDPRPRWLVPGSSPSWPPSRLPVPSSSSVPASPTACGGTEPNRRGRRQPGTCLTCLRPQPKFGPCTTPEPDPSPRHLPPPSFTITTTTPGGKARPGPRQSIRTRTRRLSCPSSMPP